MKDKQLKEKAIDIKGKKYILVSDRVIFFNSEYPNGSIVSEKSESGDRVDFKTTITPDVANPRRIFTGHSQAVWGDGYINKSSATENAETSAVGRALAMMAIGVIDSIASIDEIKKAENTAKIIPLKKGITFLGYRIFYHYKCLRKSNLRKFRKKFEENLSLCENEIIFFHYICFVHN